MSACTNLAAAASGYKKGDKNRLYDRKRVPEKIPLP